MITEFRKSVNNILSERISSPFYGAFFLSWIIWNWKPIYLTLFVDESKIEVTKIDYIVQNYSQIENLIIYPIISTILLIIIVPFLSNGAYWTSLNFNKWKIDQRNTIEKKRLLTIEQSIIIRKELKEKEFEYEEILQKREQQIDKLNLIISELQNESKVNKDLSDKNDNENNRSDFFELQKNREAFNSFENAYKYIRDQKKFPDNLSELTKEYYLVNDIFLKGFYPSGKAYIKITDKGKSIYKDIFNENYN